MSSPIPTPCRLTDDLPGIGGRIKVLAEDFEVEEIPAYAPCGSGPFLFLWVQKRGMGAEYFARQVARRLGIPVSDVGCAGLKDRHAVTRQMISVPAEVEERLGQLDGDGITLLGVHRHTNKLKPGHLHGNRFRVLIRDVAPAANERLEPLLARLREQGLPNFYGLQRFGRDGETARLGFALLRNEGGQRIGRFLRKLALSAAQAALFNAYLAQRMRDGFLRTVLVGDVMCKWPAGGMFVATDVAQEQARFDAREIIHAGPIFGRKTFAAAAVAAAREAAVLGDFDLEPKSFLGFGKLLQGTRRFNLVYVEDLAAVRENEGIRLTLTLPAGSYATILLAEITHAAETDLESQADDRLEE